MTESNDLVYADLLELAWEIAEFRDMVIAGEGNVSGSLGTGRFLVKASGTDLSRLEADQIVEVYADPLLAAIDDGNSWSDADLEALLLDARIDQGALKPSVESLFHAWLLEHTDCTFVAHAHPVAANALLCSPHAHAYAQQRLFPDQVVYCGAESVLLSYVDPGLPLAREIARAVMGFHQRLGIHPKTILIENHGVIALGSSAADAAATLKMAEKAARVFIDAVALGGPIFMTSEHVARIDKRVDERYRQRMLSG